ncbi:hypothetical protein, partial [Polynucleobacter rarus]|uniref:hypothetical protein n=1 Tax=Polynucleobacter rarus TaxID=556055 RepID=UPI00131EE23F
MLMNYKKYTLACRHCSEKALFPPRICESCGAVKTFAQKEAIRTNHSELSIEFGPSHLTCSSCFKNFSEEFFPMIYKKCKFCGQDDLDWYCEEDGTWASDYNDEQKEGTWLTGNFEGFFEEKNDSSITSSKENTLAIYQSKLTNVKRVNHPQLRQNGEIKPKQFEIINDLEVFVGSNKALRLNLKDVRLHYWKIISSYDARDPKSHYFGKIYGTLFGRLMQPEIPKEPEELADPLANLDIVRNKGIDNEVNRGVENSLTDGNLKPDAVIQSDSKKDSSTPTPTPTPTPT